MNFCLNLTTTTRSSILLYLRRKFLFPILILCIISFVEVDLRNFFSQLGKVNNIIMIRDKHTGKHKGIGYVEMADLEDVPNCLLFNNVVPEFQKVKKMFSYIMIISDNSFICMYVCMYV